MRADDLIAGLEPRGTRRSLVDHEVLIAEGEQSDVVFVVVSGELRASVATPQGDLEVGRCRTGELIGEVAALVGAPRSATMTAVGPVDVLAVDGAAFAEWLESEPEIATDVIAQARQRLHAVQVAQIAIELLGDEGMAVVPRMLELAEWVDLEAGSTLFEEGDEPDSAYFVLSGRLQVTSRQPDGSDVVLGEVARAEVVGEVAVIQRQQRSATVKAIRDSTLARFDLVQFEQLLLQHPTLLLVVVRRMVGRLTGRSRAQHRARSIAMVVTTGIDAMTVVGPMLAEVERYGACMHLTSASVDAAVGRTDIAQAAPATLADARLTQHLYELETSHDHLVYVADRHPTAWSRRAVQRADIVVVVASPFPDAEERRLIGAFLELCTDTHAPRWLAVIDAADALDPTPARLQPWSEPFDEVHHLRRGSERDLARVARLAIGQGLGLVLGGGGARGFAHLGVLRTLEEFGVQIDRVGGASMGAIFAAAVASDRPSDELFEICSKQFEHLLDYTVPVVALLKAKRITANLEEMLGGFGVGDMWIPLYCVSTNLTRSRLEVHRTGDLVTAIRASIAIPGVLPPVPFGEDLLVDGGVLDNVPADVMRADPSIATVIAVDVAPVTGPGTSENYGMYLSGWQALRRFARRRVRPYPGVASVLVRSMITGSEGKRAAMRHDGTVDLYLQLPIEGVGLLEFDKIRPVFEAGYSSSRPRVEEWLAGRDVR